MSRTASFGAAFCHFCHHSFSVLMPYFVDFLRYSPVLYHFLSWLFQEPQLEKLHLQRFFCACKWPSDDKNDDKNLAGKYRQNPHGARLSAIAFTPKAKKVPCFNRLVRFEWGGFCFLEVFFIQAKNQDRILRRGLKQILSCACIPAYDILYTGETEILARFCFGIISEITFKRAPGCAMTC